MLKTLNIIILLSLLSFFSCKKNELKQADIGILKFSKEKIEFDTIFTKNRSITSIFKIYNPSGNEIIIPKLFVANGLNSEFAINVNGTSGINFNNISVLPNDSLFIFIQANLKENFEDTLIVHMDSLCFDYKNAREYVQIVAWGQDIIKHEGEAINSTIFSAGKPHVIIDSLVINEGEILTIEAGAKLYFHYNSNLIIKGTLRVEGTLDAPVLFSSDRLDESNRNFPGQWGSLIFKETSSANTINYAEIKNGINAIVIEAGLAHVDLELHNSLIHDFTVDGLNAKAASVNCSNTIFSNINGHAIALQGGLHNFNHISLYNEGTFGNRDFKPSLLITDYNTKDSSNIEIDNIKITNSVLLGKLLNEIEIDVKSSANILISHCLIKDVLSTQEKEYFENPTSFDKTKSLFYSPFNYNFSLDSLSQTIDLGKLEFGEKTEFDRNNNSRIIDNKPDIGAYEYFYKED